MKQIFGYIRTFYQEEFKTGYGIFILLFSGLILYLNYFYPGTNTIHKTQRWQDTSVLYYFGIYFGVFALAALAQTLFYKKAAWAFLKDYRFWLTAFFGIAVWACRNSRIYYYTLYLAYDMPRVTVGEQTIYRVIFTLLKGLVAFIPLFVFWWFRDKKEQPLYGMQRGKLNLKPYLIMLAIMIPIIVIASQDASFLRKYPRAQLISAIELFNPDHAGYLKKFGAIASAAS